MCVYIPIGKGEVFVRMVCIIKWAREQLINVHGRGRRSMYLYIYI